MLKRLIISVVATAALAVSVVGFGGTVEAAGPSNTHAINPHGGGYGQSITMPKRVSPIFVPGGNTMIMLETVPY